MRKKHTDEPDTILDPAYWHLLPEERRQELQTELEDTLEAALDEGEPVVADDKFWDRVWDRAIEIAAAEAKTRGKDAKG